MIICLLSNNNICCDNLSIHVIHNNYYYIIFLRQLLDVNKLLLKCQIIVSKKC